MSAGASANLTAVGAVAIISLMGGAIFAYWNYGRARDTRQNALQDVLLSERMFQRASSTATAGFSLASGVETLDVLIRNNMQPSPWLAIPLLVALGSGVLSFASARKARETTGYLRRH